MTWTDRANSASEHIEQARGLIYRVYRWYRRDDELKAHHAIGQTALAFGLTERKTRSLIRGEPVAVAIEEYQAIKNRYRQRVRQRSVELLAQAEAMEEEERQMVMRL
jgi:hypothetical protein